MDPFNTDLCMPIVDAIDNKNIIEIKKLNNNFNKKYKNNKNNKIDIIFELYNNNLLTVERLQFILSDCSKYLNISSDLIKKKLIKNEEISLLDIIFNNLIFCDDITEFILQLLLYYKNKKEYLFQI